MAKKIHQSKVPPGRRSTKEDAADHDFMTWFSLPSHLEGPHEDTTRCLRTVKDEAVDQTTTGVSQGPNGTVINTMKFKKALKKSMRMKCNRRRNSARGHSYRLLGIYLDTFVPQASVQDVVVNNGVVANSDVEGAPAPLPGITIGDRLVLDHDGTQTKRMLDLDATAAALLGEFLGIVPVDVRKSARAAGAACVQDYLVHGELFRCLRPESGKVRNAVVQNLNDELQDAAARDINLSDDETD